MPAKSGTINNVGDLVMCEPKYQALIYFPLQVNPFPGHVNMISQPTSRVHIAVK